MRLFNKPLHPYTQALLSAIPHPKPRRKKNRIVLRGEMPNPINPPTGCHFHPRCPMATEQCKRAHPLKLERSGPWSSGGLPSGLKRRMKIMHSVFIWISAGLMACHPPQPKNKVNQDSSTSVHDSSAPLAPTTEPATEPSAEPSSEPATEPAGEPACENHSRRGRTPCNCQ